MGPYGPATKPAYDIDGHLAGAGYVVLSSDLHHVAQRLERIESNILTSAVPPSLPHADHHPSFFHTDAIHYNPSDLATWVDSVFPALCPCSPSMPTAQIEDLPWPDLCPQQPTQLAAAASAELDSGVQLVHLLMSCAECVQRGDSSSAGSLIDEMRGVLSRVGTAFGIGKVAGYFIDALTRRLYCPNSGFFGSAASSALESEILYHHFYEACPYLKFAHFTANQAILEAFEGHSSVHVVDFSLMHGLQWPALIQALALRPGGPPFLRLTGIGPPSPDGRDSLREIGLRLAELARSVGVRFAFRGVAANRLDDVRPWMLQVAGAPVEEAVAVNSVMQLHRLLDDSVRVESVLGWIKGMKPKIVTVVEQEADHNKAGFLDRFTEALFYYSTMFDSLEGGGGGGVGGEQSAVAEVYLQREICNIVCCEGAERVERHEPLGRWRERMRRAGFRATHLGSNAFKQASMLLTLFSSDGYCVEEVDGCLTLGWHSRPLISASAWRADVAADDHGVVASTTTTTNPGVAESISTSNNRSSSSSGSGSSNNGGDGSGGGGDDVGRDTDYDRDLVNGFLVGAVN